MKWVEGNRIAATGALETVKLEVSEGQIKTVRVFAQLAAQLPLLSAGFVDLHVHGGGQADTMDATAEAFAAITKTHARFGTTSLLLTSVTDTPERIADVLTAAAAYMREEPTGARVAGVHLEGPFIHPEKAGAQRPDRILAPNPQLAAKWFDSGIVKMITLAPELPAAHEVARLAQTHGIVASVGHTQATATDMLAAQTAGFSHVTHLCNAMRPLLHREVGPIGHVVVDESFTADLICDGIHVDAAMIKTLLRAIGAERIMLITDAIRATAVGPGTYDLGGLEVTVRDGACRLANGTLAGSVLTMSQAVRQIQHLGGVAPDAAQRMASYQPAKRIGLTHKGRVETGFDADLVALGEDGEPLWTMVGGRMAYER